MAKLFLSHSSKDTALTVDLRAFLAERHHEVFLDHDPVDGIAPGAEWERTLYERLQWADAVLCVVTPNYVESRWCFAEIAIAKSQGRLIVPLAVDARVSHPLLTAIQHIVLDGDRSAALDRLAERLAAIDAGGGIAWNPERAVFPGLAAFDTADRAMFFGRDREVGALLKEIRGRVQQRLPRAVVVVGASGSGKSSLVRAGLIPRLLDDPDWWRLEPLMPGSAPLTALTDAFARSRKEVALPPAVQAIADQLPNGIGRIARDILLAAEGNRRHLLVVIDQMEEAFTRASDADRRVFLNALAAAVSESDGPVAVVATLRSEFLDELLRTPDASVLREHPFLLAPLGNEYLEAVITRPSEKAQLRFEPSLVRRLVADTGSGEALPLLAFTLARLVDGLNPGDRVGLDRYTAIGGVQGSIEIQAEAALAALVTTERAEADVLAVVTSFATLDDAGHPVRRRRRRSALSPDALAVVAAFEHARLLTTDTVDGVELVSVAHETLFTAWKKLAAAIAAAEAELRLRRDLERSAAEWNREDRRPSYCWRGDRLVRALQLFGHAADLSEIEQAFIRESTAHSRDEAERESTILADRVVASGLLERDPELALLYLLAAVDEFAATPQIVAAMRRALAAQRLVGRVGPVGNRALCAAVRDDGELIAIADLGTNEVVRPSTRSRPRPSAGEVCISLWKMDEPQPRTNTSRAGRRVGGMAWSRDGSILVVIVDARVEVLDATTLATKSAFDLLDDAGAPRVSSGDRRIEVSEDNTRIEIDATEGESPEAYACDGVRWLAIPANGAARDGGRFVAKPATFTHLIACPYAGLLLNVTGSHVEVWAADPVDAPTPATLEEAEHTMWVAGPAAADVLAVSVDGRWRCAGPRPHIVDVVEKTESTLPWPFAMAAAFSFDRHRVALATRMEIGIFDVATHDVIATLGRHTDEEGDTYTSVALNQDGTLVATGSRGGGRAHVWDVASGRPIRQIDGTFVTLSADGRFVASSTIDGGLIVHAIDGGALRLSGEHALRHLFDRANSAVLAVTAFKAVEYSLPVGSVAAEYPRDPELIGFSADGRHVLGSGNRLLKWPDRSPEAVIARARKAVYRTLTDEERDRFGLRRPPRALE